MKLAKLVEKKVRPHKCVFEYEVCFEHAFNFRFISFENTGIDCAKYECFQRGKLLSKKQMATTSSLCP